MKKIIIITAIFSLLSYSCQDFLTEDYLSGENSVTLTTSEDGMERLVVASYIFLRVWYAKENQWDLTESGTDLYTWGLDNRSAGYCTYTGWVGEEQDRMAAMWFELYTALNSCNLGLRDIDKLSYENSELQEARKGELHFLRAHYLWLIVENWGPVHFMLDPVEEAIYTANKTPISVFYEQIILDLEAALDHVQESTSEYGRITEPVTRAFLARIHLMWASYLKNGLNINGQVFVEPDYAESQVHYDLALDYAEEVMNDYNYQLLGNWEDIWDIDNIKNEEVVWAVNKFFIEQEYTGSGKTVNTPGAPYKTSRNSDARTHPAPMPGEHNEMIYRQELGLTDNNLNGFMIARSYRILCNHRYSKN